MPGEQCSDPGGDRLAGVAAVGLPLPTEGVLMAGRIYRYELPFISSHADEVRVEVQPMRVLRLDVLHGEVMLWGMVDTSTDTMLATFELYATAQNVSGIRPWDRYVGSVQMRNGLGFILCGTPGVFLS